MRWTPSDVPKAAQRLTKRGFWTQTLSNSFRMTGTSIGFPRQSLLFQAYLLAGIVAVVAAIVVSVLIRRGCAKHIRRNTGCFSSDGVLPTGNHGVEFRNIMRPAISSVAQFCKRVQSLNNRRNPPGVQGDRWLFRACVELGLIRPAEGEDLEPNCGDRS